MPRMAILCPVERCRAGMPCLVLSSSSMSSTIRLAAWAISTAEARSRAISRPVSRPKVSWMSMSNPARILFPCLSVVSKLW